MQDFRLLPKSIPGDLHSVTDWRVSGGLEALRLLLFLAQVKSREFRRDACPALACQAKQFPPATQYLLGRRKMLAVAKRCRSRRAKQLQPELPFESAEKLSADWSCLCLFWRSLQFAQKHRNVSKHC